MYKYKLQSEIIVVPEEFADWETIYYVQVGDKISHCYEQDCPIYDVIRVEPTSDYTILWVE